MIVLDKLVRAFSRHSSFYCDSFVSYDQKKTTLSRQFQRNIHIHVHTIRKYFGDISSCDQPDDYMNAKLNSSRYPSSF